MRIVDPGRHSWAPSEFDGDVPPFDLLSAALAVAFAADGEAGNGVTCPGATFVMSPYEAQRRLHGALIADLDLPCKPATFQEAVPQRVDRVVLDLPWQATFPDVPGKPASFHIDAGFIDAAFAAAWQEVIVLGDACNLLTGLSPGDPLRHHVEALEQTGKEVEDFPRRLLTPAKDLHTHGLGFFLRLKQAHRMIQRDLAAAKKRIVWNLPEASRDDSEFIRRRPDLDQVLIQPLSAPVARRYEFLGYRVSDQSRGESAIFVDDDVAWILGSPRMGELVRPFVRICGCRTAGLLAELYGLSKCYKPSASL